MHRQQQQIGRVGPAMKRAIVILAFGLAGWSASGAARADCFDEAARYQKVNPLVLRAIAWQESHNRPDALHKNDNGSTDYGLMQINSVHLPTLSQYGISTGTLMEPCKNVYVAAWHLRQKMNKYGNSWKAIGAYHSETPALRDRYARQIADILVRWKLISASR
jgi:soluble lytic murein transglycosylase-like protein